MNNLDFEKWLQERLYDHTEPVDPNSWVDLLANINARKRQKVVFKRFLYTTSAAAAVVLFLLLRPVMFTEPDRTIERSISVVNPEQMIDLPEQEPVQIAVLTPRISKRTHTVATVTNTVSEEVEAQVEIPIPDTTFKLPPSFPPDTLRSSTIRYLREQRQESYTPKRRYASEGWSIALASTYSNAAGEAFFTPKIQVASGSTRIYNTADYSSINQEQSKLSFSPPISIGINFQKELYPWLSLGLGVNYTLLQSKYAYNSIGEEYTNRNSYHYIGLPVSALFLFVHQPKLRVYASVGGMVEKAVTAHSLSTSKFTRKSESFYVKGLQWSVHAGLGIEIPVYSFIGFYLEPGMGYFFDNNQPQSIRTVQPAQFKAELGLRVRI